MEITRDTFNRNMKSDIRRIISKACDINDSNFKQNVTLAELINYKVDKRFIYKSSDIEDSDKIKFTIFVSAVDKIQNGIKAKFPFINPELIDLSWTTNEIINEILRIYNNIPTYTMLKK